MMTKELQTTTTTVLFLLAFSTVLQPRILSAIQSDQQDLNYLKFTYNATEFSPEQEYDYIVVGGGTAGCPLATTLSENYSVLVLERGGVAYADPNVQLEERILLNLLQADDNDSPAQTFTSEDGIPNARARVLGGGSMINIGFYSRADKDFYVRSGIDWDMDVVDKAYEWVEETVVFRPDRLDIWQSSVKEALLESGNVPDNGYTLDHIVGTKIGGSTFDERGRRHGAVELLNKANPKNLQVVVHATVERLIFSSSKSSGLTAVGVIYRDSMGRSHQVQVGAKGEVILSAGAIGSPQLLLLSGVGPKTYLSSLNIPVVYHQPFVGQFMADNPKSIINIVSPFAVERPGTKVVGITNGSYIEAFSPLIPFSSPYDFILFPGPYPPINITVAAIFEKLSRPLSKGSLRLASPTNVSRSPIVRFNYFANPKDLSQCVTAVRNIGNMLRTRAMEQYKFEDQFGKRYFKFAGLSLPENLFDNAAMETFCRNTLSTIWHYHGGCLVKKVVDPDFRVIGINALRVLDGSTFVDSPGTNPQATLLMLGRYIGLKIQKERMDKDIST